jgi:tetratricopeptide (TPR) repeat protein
MDPISRMVQEFKNQWLRFRQSEKVRLFRIDTAPQHHHDLIRLLRSVEMSPDNRSPYIVFSAPFRSRAEYYAAATNELKAVYALIREGLAKDGVEVGEPSLALTRWDSPEEFLAKHLAAMWSQVAKQFEYIMVILMPSAIEDKADWPKSVEQLYTLLTPLKVRLAVADGPDGLLVPLFTRFSRRGLTGRFAISDRTLQEYLFKVAAGGWAAVEGGGATAVPPPTANISESVPAAAARLSLPPAPTVLPPPATKTVPAKPQPTLTALPGLPATAAVPPANGQPNVLPPDEALRFRTLMAAAASASAEQKPEKALEALHEARDVCRHNGLASHEAIVLMAIGNTHAAMEKAPDAIHYYQSSIAVARQSGAPVVAAQAGLALGSALFRANDFERAAMAYEKAAQDAKACESDILFIETLRMAGTCHNLRQKPDDAMRCWKLALLTSAKLSPAECQFSNWEQVGQAFGELCRQRGLHAQAKSIAQQVEAIKRQAAAAPVAAH